MKIKLFTFFNVMAMACLLVLNGCTAIEKSDAMDTERMLSAAGFKLKFADTPEKLAQLQSMTQRKVVVHNKVGIPYYAYADAEFCKCLYLGSERNYARYQRMNIQTNIAEMNRDAALNWPMWGAWGPWY